MATFKSFEEIEAWQLARQLTREIYALTDNGTFAGDYGLRDQIRRASVSILSNIAEGFERDGAKEFAQFLSLAKGSAGEVRAQLYVALDQNYIDREIFDRLQTDLRIIGRKLSGLMKYLRQTPYNGTKYRKT